MSQLQVTGDDDTAFFTVETNATAHEFFRIAVQL